MEEKGEGWGGPAGELLAPLLRRRSFSHVRHVREVEQKRTAKRRRGRADLPDCSCVQQPVRQEQISRHISLIRNDSGRSL